MRILAINNTFNSSTVGGIRSRLLVNALTGRGHHVSVLTSTADTVGGLRPEVDEVKVKALSLERLLQLFKPGYQGEYTPSKVAGTKSKSVSQGGRLRNLLNRWCMVPDKFFIWIQPAVRAGNRLLQEETVDVIYATTPVRSNLIVGTRLSRKHGIPLIVEYRDLWTGNPYYHNSFPTRIHTWLHQSLEASVIKQATKITSVSQGIRNVLINNEKLNKSGDVGLNYNFYDPACFEDIEKNPSDTAFTVVYVGALYGSRQPYVFFDGMKQFLEQTGLTPAEFSFDCIGRSHGIGDVEAHIKKLGLSDYIRFVGQVPHQEAITRLYQADAALIVQAPEDESHIPAKLYETLGARTPTLLICPECETAKILEDCSAGVACRHDPEVVTKGLEKIYAQWKSGKAWPFNENAIEEYSLDKAVIRFEELLQSAIDLNAE